jgi:hypothetical protein
MLMSHKGTEVVLSGARRLWRWSGANTLHEVALHGVDQENTRLSEAVERITLTQAVEVIPTTEEAATNLSRSRWAK